MNIRISFYELLTTYRYLSPQGFPQQGVPSKPVDFALEPWLQHGVDLGIKSLRFFADLPYFWNPTMQRPKFQQDWSELLYNQKGISSWDFGGPINPGFQSRIDTLVKVGRKNNLDYLICAATQGPDYGCPFFYEMGYPTSDDYYDRANFPNFVASGAWGRLQTYYRDLWGLLDPYPNRFVYAESYNEGDPGMEELAENRPRKKKFQLDMPFPIPPEVKVNALRNIGVKRFCFHQVFTPLDAASMVTQAKQFGIAASEIELSTDGATPWRNPDGTYKFTFPNHNGHYKVKPYWNANKVNKAGVIDAHVAIRDKAAQLGVASVDFQSVLKWNQEPAWTTDADDWVRAILA
jgi:hypothetical protein